MDTSCERPQSRIFWRDMGAAGHACQVYTDVGQLLDTLTAYVGGGLWTNEAVVVIANNRHLDRLDQMLRQSGLDLAHFRSDDRYIALSAEATLARFSIDGWPDEVLFNQVMGQVVERASRGGRPVRAYGEMVAILWARGEYRAAIRLEELWNSLIARERFRLLCGYPRAEFQRADAQSREAARATHTVFMAA